MSAHRSSLDQGQRPGAIRPTITCIIPTHRRDESLLPAIVSVLEQTLAPQKVVVVDDTGSQTTAELVDSLRHRGIELVYCDASEEPVKGAAASRNRGAREADTDLLAFLDDDDYWRPDFLRAATAERVRSGAELVVTWGALERAGTRREDNWRAEPGRSANDVLADNPGVTGSNMLIDRDAFEAIAGFDRDMWVYNDLDFLVRFLDAGLRYSVVRSSLVVQSIVGAEHLSSRGERRAQGIEHYISTYSGRLTPRQRRKLRRNVHLARMFPGQTRPLLLAHFLGVAITSTADDWWAAIRRRATRVPSYN
ncbi:glycosyltransferase [Rathayibacter sp. ZW T2_19]|uniref:Glycosyltransferase n=1 Tax=Rathayibacter rubneri TaxID=2950106 RepID=A0A9X2DU37_9MICO|nr:glycosyltransferase [Rathayibacter rubneri]MCM6761090.1 glycosyltransferase [Rathayibacter rubneri]